MASDEKDDAGVVQPPPIPLPSLQRLDVGDFDGVKRSRLLGIRKGMVFWGRVDAHQAAGAEQHHDGFCSPWLVVSSKRWNDSKASIAQVVPLTTQLDKPKLPTRILLERERFIDYVPTLGRTPSKPLDQQAQMALVEQVRVFAHDRFSGDPVAILQREALYEIEAALRYLFDLDA